MKNGALQNFVTVAAAIFTVGMIWNRVSTNAAQMRVTLEEVQAEQREMRKMIETLVIKP